MSTFTDKWEEANKENLEGLSFIDDGKRKLFYRFTPAKMNPVGAPLLVILHGHGTRGATRFQRKGWNVLSPVDHFGCNGNGCWWLGENGDFFVKDLLQSLIKKIAKEYRCENNIYFYGSSMGGYGAILHGILCNARAVYANVPQIKLLNTRYSDEGMLKNFQYIFGNSITKENDLVNYLKPNSKFPIFYICENIIAKTTLYQNYFEEHAKYFLDKCHEYQLKYHCELLPKSGHDKNYGIGEVLDKFMRFTPPLEPYQCENIANIFYPSILSTKDDKLTINKSFLLDNGKVLKVSVEGLFKFKFLFADENCLIVQQNTNTIAISFDEGKSFDLIKCIDGLKIFQIYPLSNGNYLLGGTEKSTSVLYVLDSNLNILKRHDDLGERTWHAHSAIDEAYGIVMYIDYQNFNKGASLPENINIFRSKDFGLSWEKVYSLKHPEEVRHGHTLQADPYKENTWLATTGDTPSQSRWFLSKDNGTTWIEVTDKSYVNDAVKNRSLSAHRATSIEITEDYYYFTTDDLMGGVLDYFTEYFGERKASSKFYRAKKVEPIKLEKLTNLGIHGRSMIDVGDGYIVVTEAKYVSFNSQVFYIDKSNLNKAYFLFDIYGNKRHAGTASMNSVFLKQRYFYTAINRGQFLDSDIQSLKWNIALEKNKSHSFEYKIENYVKFEEHLWFLNNTNSIDDISFKGNSVHLTLKDMDNTFYLLLGDKSFNRLNPKQLYSIKSYGAFKIEFYALYDKSNLTFFVEFYDDEQKIDSKSQNVICGKNSFNFYTPDNAKYIKVLFRIKNSSKDSIILSDLSIHPVINLLPTVVSHYIQSLDNLEAQFYLLTFSHSYYSDSYKFRPRKDLDYFNITLPLDWDINPFHETNWKFQLHALRLIDRELVQYIQFKETAVLERIIEVILDWKRDIVDNKKNFDFNREENPDSFAWHDMATGLRALKIAYLLETLIKQEKLGNFSQYLDDFYFLAMLHIEALSKQKIAPNNHAIYQMHGLMMLLRLFPNDFENIDQLKQQTEDHMLDIFYKQFFHEGIHKENSSRYHYLAIETFQKILSPRIYPDLDEVFVVLNRAKENCAYMHFPNFESLMTGDSDYAVVEKVSLERIQNGITFFKESGYTYVYEQEGESMLYLNTAFLNRAHKHADFFNILLYEYGKNILVDAGKYSYVKDNPFRKYCISTRAHNTVLIDNEDYKLDRKYFFESKLLKYEKRGDHYYLQTDHHYDYWKTIHQRHIYYKPQAYLLVVDVLNAEENRNFKQIFHLHQDLEIVENDNFLQTEVVENVIMFIRMKSIPLMGRETDENIRFSKGIEGEIEGYRALGHNEVVENYVLVNEAESTNVILASMFSFHQDRDFKLTQNGGKLNIELDGVVQL